MRIAFFTDTYLPTMDGVVRHICLYRKYLEKMGHEVFIFAPGTKKQKEENDDPHVYYFTSATFKPYPDYKIALFPFLSATRKITDIGPDIIHAHGIATTGIAAFQAAEKIQAPAIATFHTLVSEALHYLAQDEGLRGKLKDVVWRYLRWYYGHFRCVLVPSRFVEQILIAQGIRNTRVYPSGIEYSFFAKRRKKDVLQKYGVESPYVLFVGRVAKEKRLEDLINAALNILNKRSELKFVIVGKGPGLEEYKNMVHLKGLDDHFVFTGFVPDEDLPAFYQHAEVFVLPSRFDTQALSVLEAMAAGCPVVVHGQSAPAEFVGGAGLTFESVPDLAEKVLRAIEERAELSKHAKAIAKEYDIKKRVKALCELYEQLR